MTDQHTEGHQICPRCGTKVSGDATHCVVCGTDLGGGGGSLSSARRELTLSLPLAVGLLVIFTVIAAGATYAAITVGGLAEPAVDIPDTATPTVTSTATATVPPTATDLPAPTPTPLTHTVAENETCLALAAFFNVSVQSIVQLNALGTQCLLSVGQTLLIPQPTATPSPEPSATLPAAEATRVACQTVNYTVEANDTLVGIATNYNVNMQAIMEYNGKNSETVFVGELLVIPLCERNPTPGPTATSTPPPPHPAPNLLLPPDGAPFSLADDTVSLQWAAVGQLREGEFYKVTILDVTDGSGTIMLEAFVTDTNYIVPTEFRPETTTPHVIRWIVTTVRQTGTDALGEPFFASAGGTSESRNFTWSGSAPAATATP